MYKSEKIILGDIFECIESLSVFMNTCEHNFRIANISLSSQAKKSRVTDLVLSAIKTTGETLTLLVFFRCTLFRFFPSIVFLSPSLQYLLNFLLVFLFLLCPSVSLSSLFSYFPLFFKLYCRVSLTLFRYCSISIYFQSTYLYISILLYSFKSFTFPLLICFYRTHFSFLSDDRIHHCHAVGLGEGRHVEMMIQGW